MNGKMPYRDVFDQKGMLLYFLYGLSYLISHTTFFGVYLLEVVLAALDLAAIYKILRFFLRKETAILLSPLCLACIFGSYSFYWGGSAEEICLPLLFWGLFLGMQYFYAPREDNAFRKELLIAGILAGGVANIKFTGLGFFFGWMAVIGIAQWVRHGFLRAVKSCLWFLLGMAIPFVPWLIYFGITGGLYEWYWGYVYVNVFMYSNLDSEGPSAFERIYTLSKTLYWVALDNIPYFLFVIPGFFASVIGKKRKGRMLIPTMAFFTFFGIYVGGSVLPYYALPLGVFAVWGFILVGEMLEKLFSNLLEKVTLPQQYFVCLTGFVGVLFATLLCFASSMNVPYHKVSREDHFLTAFQEIVCKKENPTLLNIGCLDAGLYTVCDVVPSCRWFQSQTINTDMVSKEQERYIEEEQIDFVLARDWIPEVLTEHYELALSYDFVQTGRRGEEFPFTYYLYQRK